MNVNCDIGDIRYNHHYTMLSCLREYVTIAKAFERPKLFSIRFFSRLRLCVSGPRIQPFIAFGFLLRTHSSVITGPKPNASDKCMRLHCPAPIYSTEDDDVHYDSDLGFDDDGTVNLEIEFSANGCSHQFGVLVLQVVQSSITSPESDLHPRLVMYITLIGCSRFSSLPRAQRLKS